MVAPIQGEPWLSHIAISNSKMHELDTVHRCHRSPRDRKDRLPTLPGPCFASILSFWTIIFCATFTRPPWSRCLCCVT
ncbi:hypothetical protein ARMGADRAFT_444525 [Armillaria gallica]|uniref:Uncharacterized protein n=1 Tax=Armillaria gallica TaxID=47427 RepID=A0A2H3CXN5_ARMGA|nr:hypothetical protein ARMGADRAFT_444525 [Armillaria gallica]